MSRMRSFHLQNVRPPSRRARTQPTCALDCCSSHGPGSAGGLHSVCPSVPLTHPSGGGEHAGSRVRPLAPPPARRGPSRRGPSRRQVQQLCPRLTALSAGRVERVAVFAQPAAGLVRPAVEAVDGAAPADCPFGAQLLVIQSHLHGVAWAGDNCGVGSMHVSQNLQRRGRELAGGCCVSNGCFVRTREPATRAACMKVRMRGFIVCHGCCPPCCSTRAGRAAQARAARASPQVLLWRRKPE